MPAVDRQQDDRPRTTRRIRCSQRLAAAIVCVASVAASAQPATGLLDTSPGSPVTLTLDNGDTLSGDLVASDAAAITIDHAIIGRVSIDRSRLSALRGAVGGSPDRRHTATAPTPTLTTAGAPVMATVRPEPDPPRPPAAPSTPAPAPAGDAGAASQPGAPPAAPSEPRPQWSGRLALGFNGSDGNADRLRLRYDAGATRKHKGETLNLNLAYSIANEGARRSEHWLRASARNAWAYRDTPWEAFAEGESEFDEFKDYDVRVNAGGGAAYRVLDSERTKLTTRAGLGARREFGGGDTAITPEAIAGFELAHQLNERHRLTAQATWFPSLENVSDFRATGRAAWEILIDPKLNLTLQFGAEDRYDSTPNGREKNDLDYFAQIVLKF